MIALERKQFIIKLLKKNKVVTVSELSKEVAVSEETIRRDLEKLEQEDIIRRVHGGAYLKDGYKEVTSIHDRAKMFMNEKELIARACVDLIEDKEAILLDFSTTAVCLAKEMVTRKNHNTVITNSLSVANELANCETIKVIMLGGELNHYTNAFHGSTILDSLERYYADRAFISGAGIHVAMGLCDYTQEEADIRRKMLERAESCCFAADLTKIGKHGAYKTADLSSIDYLVVSDPFEEKEEQLSTLLQEHNIETIVCKRDTI